MERRAKFNSRHFSIGEFIRFHLLQQGEDYINATWRAFQEAMIKEGILWRGNYYSFVKHFKCLERLGLIELVREEEPAAKKEEDKKWLKKRKYYRVVEEYLDLDTAWKNPQAVLNPAVIYGKKRYRKKKEEAIKRGITVNQLALEEYPDLRKVREKLGLQG